MTAATGDPSPWPAADIRISTLPYELLASVIFHARARVIIARCASGESIVGSAMSSCQRQELCPSQ